MGTGFGSKISDVVERENIKRKMLDIFIEYADDFDTKLSSEQKDFILDRTDHLVELYDVYVQYNIVGIENDEGEVVKKLVPLEQVEDLIKRYRVKTAAMIFHIIKDDLENNRLDR